MRPLQIFISHSSSTEGTQRFRDSIYRALETDGKFKPLLDSKDLEDGGEWRKALFTWMREVHGAVLIVSKASLESNFVPIEASIFAFRRSIRESFPILPVLIDGTQIKDLNEGVFGSLAIGEIGCICPKDPDEAAQRVLAALKAALRDPLVARTPMERREDEIVRHLRASGLSEADLESIASSWEERAPSEDLYQAFAAALLKVDYSVACTALRHLISLNHSSSEALSAILGIVTPFWVQETAAVPITEVAIADQSRRLLAIDAHYPETPHAYICRAYTRPFNSKWSAVSLQPPDQEDSMDALRNQLLSAFAPHATSRGGRSDPSRERLLNQLAQREKSGSPVFAIFPRDWLPDPEFLDALRNEFPTLTIIAVAEPGVNRFRDLESPGKERESEAWATYDQTFSELDDWRVYA